MNPAGQEGAEHVARTDKIPAANKQSPLQASAEGRKWTAQMILVAGGRQEASLQLCWSRPWSNDFNFATLWDEDLRRFVGLWEAVQLRALPISVTLTLEFNDDLKEGSHE